MKTRAPTVLDVARVAGVSTATVSRVLNNTAEARPETRQAVLAAVDSLGYRPNPLARDLRRWRSQRVLALFPELNSPVMTDLYRGVVDVARENGYVVLLAPTLGDPDRELELIQLARSRSVDALICLGTSLSAEELNDLGRTEAIIQVLECYDAPNTARISIDDVAAARDLTGHLLSLGHRDIAFLGNRLALPGRLREEGVRQALAGAGVPLLPDLVSDGDYGFQHGRDATRRLLGLPQPPTAVACVSDVVAAGVVAEARAMGMRVPQDVAVAGFDDSREATMSVPPITTVRQPFEEIGRISFRTLLHNLNNSTAPDHSHRMVPHELVLRESTIGPA
ncbi:MAG: LacI family transcriptional regulator [Bifidobacteriaceae bacterium]|jgi:LacI family repressor for deo operon, udp, cdd, tsx, nupC, and nupG|nr:LacI family transcriptional regulator [Bifidobacteriaceae bacterium]